MANNARTEFEAQQSALAQQRTTISAIQKPRVPKSQLYGTGLAGRQARRRYTRQFIEQKEAALARQTKAEVGLAQYEKETLVPYEQEVEATRVAELEAQAQYDIDLKAYNEQVKVGEIADAAAQAQYEIALVKHEKDLAIYEKSREAARWEQEKEDARRAIWESDVRDWQASKEKALQEWSDYLQPLSPEQRAVALKQKKQYEQIEQLFPGFEPIPIEREAREQFERLKKVEQLFPGYEPKPIEREAREQFEQLKKIEQLFPGYEPKPIAPLPTVEELKAQLTVELPPPKPTFGERFEEVKERPISWLVPPVAAFYMIEPEIKQVRGWLSRERRPPEGAVTKQLFGVGTIAAGAGAMLIDIPTALAHPVETVKGLREIPSMGPRLGEIIRRQPGYAVGYTGAMIWGPKAITAIKKPVITKLHPSALGEFKTILKSGKEVYVLKGTKYGDLLMAEGAWSASEKIAMRAQLELAKDPGRYVYTTAVKKGYKTLKTPEGKLFFEVESRKVPMRGQYTSPPSVIQIKDMPMVLPYYAEIGPTLEIPFTEWISRRMRGERIPIEFGKKRAGVYVFGEKPTPLPGWIEQSARSFSEGRGLPSTARKTVNVWKERFLRKEYVDPTTGKPWTIEQKIKNIRRIIEGRKKKKATQAQIDYAMAVYEYSQSTGKPLPAGIEILSGLEPWGPELQTVYPLGTIFETTPTLRQKFFKGFRIRAPSEKFMRMGQERYLKRTKTGQFKRFFESKVEAKYFPGLERGAKFAYVGKDVLEIFYPKRVWKKPPTKRILEIKPTDFFKSKEIPTQRYKIVETYKRILTKEQIKEIRLSIEKRVREGKLGPFERVKTFIKEFDEARGVIKKKVLIKEPIPRRRVPTPELRIRAPRLRVRAPVVRVRPTRITPIGIRPTGVTPRGLRPIDIRPTRVRPAPIRVRPPVTRVRPTPTRPIGERPIGFRPVRITPRITERPIDRARPPVTRPRAPIVRPRAPAVRVAPPRVRPPVTKIKPPLIPIFKEARKRAKKIRERQPIFQAQVKRQGKWEDYETPGPKKQVVGRTKEHLDTTLKASMRVKNIRTKKFVPLLPSKRYRNPKGKVKTPTILIEKRKYRLSTKKEVTDIHAKRRMKK